MQSRGSFPLFPGIVALLVLSFTGCNEVELNSTWRDREIAVDGMSTDWQNAMAYVEKPGVAIGLRNDAEYMYVCLMPADRRMAAQMLALGFMAWFDPEGGKSKTFGIHFIEGAAPNTARCVFSHQYGVKWVYIARAIVKVSPH